MKETIDRIMAKIEGFYTSEEVIRACLELAYLEGEKAGANKTYESFVAKIEEALE